MTGHLIFAMNFSLWCYFMVIGPKNSGNKKSLSKNLEHLCLILLESINRTVKTKKQNLKNEIMQKKKQKATLINKKKTKQISKLIVIKKITQQKKVIGKL